MDILAHGLWSNVMYKVIPQTSNDKRQTRWGIAFAIIPDLVAFAPFFLFWFWQLASGKESIAIGRPDFTENAFTRYAAEAYNYSHSFVIWVIVIGVVYIIWKKFPWFLLGWGLHIGIDIFSHTTEFYATPFLFPFSEFKVNAVSWGHPVFMAINYGLILLIYLIIFPYFKKKKTI